MVAGDRRAMLAAVHVARKQLGLDEAAYRAVVLRVTGVDSAGAADPRKLPLLLDEFRRLGFQDRLGSAGGARGGSRAPGRNGISRKPHVRKVYALWRALKPFLAAAPEKSDQALRTFTARQTGVESPDWLDPEQANKVIEGLKAWLARARAGEKASRGRDRPMTGQRDAAEVVRVPAELHWLSAIVGDAATLTLIEHYGGLRLKVPARADASTLRQLIGPEAARRLVAARGGELLRIPLAKRWRAQVYRARGMAVSKIAKRLAMTEKGVQGFLAGTHAPRQSRQLDLLETIDG